MPAAAIAQMVKVFSSQVEDRNVLDIANHRAALGFLLLSLLFLTGMEIAAKRLTVFYLV